MVNLTQKIVIRQVKPEDAEAIWEIRNHPDNRRYFNRNGEIDSGYHRLWFISQYFERKDNFCLVLESDRAVVGYCRLDLTDNCHLISIALHPKAQGKCLGHQLLNRATACMSAGSQIRAEVKKDNPASIKLFRKNNFQIIKEDADNYYF